MFKREYILQKILLTIAMIAILIYAGSFLSDKNGISSYEAENFTIANSNESLGDSPYHQTCVSALLEEDYEDLPYLLKFSYVRKHISDYWDKGSTKGSLNESENYSNTDWIENSYYYNLLHVDREQVYDFSAVTNKCVATQNAPFYYWLLHFFSSLFDGIGIYHVVFFIHAIILFGSAFLVFTISEKYMNSGWAGFVAAIFYGLCMGCFANLLCASPYLLSGFFMLVCIYLTFSLFQHDSMSLLFGQVMIAANVLGNLTDYTYTLFSLLLGLVICVALFCYHRKNDMLRLMLVWVLSSAITVLLYPAALMHLSFHLFDLKEHVGTLFASGELVQVFANNWTQINHQTFARTYLFVGTFLLVIIIFAGYFKKRTFHEVYEDWYHRLMAQDIAEMLLMIITFLYFVAICFVNPEKSYFVLSTLLPLFCLVFCYILYHLGLAILHTERNSGILGLLVVCFICFFSLKTGTIDFIYTDNAANVDFASTYNQEYCIFVSSDSMTVKDHLLELEKYEHSIVLDKNNLKTLKKNQTFQSLNQVLVYLSNEDYAKGVMDVVADYGNFELSKEVYNYRDENGTHIYVYQLQQMKVG